MLAWQSYNEDVTAVFSKVHRSKEQIMKCPSSMILMVMLAAVFSFGCSSKQGGAESNAARHVAVEQVQLTDSLKASRIENLYFSAQPAMTDFAVLKDQGFVQVINMRRPSEHDEPAERYQVRFHRMRYDNLPFGPEDELTDAFVNKVFFAVSTNSTRGKVLIHCSTSNRAGMVAGAYVYKEDSFMQTRSVSKAQAKAIAKDAGMQSSMAPKLDTYLNSQP